MKGHHCGHECPEGDSKTGLLSSASGREVEPTAKHPSSIYSVSKEFWTFHQVQETAASRLRLEGFG